MSNKYVFLMLQYLGLQSLVENFYKFVASKAFSTLDNYSPAAIIRNAKIGNIILLLAFFRTLGSNLDLENPAVTEENCLKNLLLLP